MYYIQFRDTKALFAKILPRKGEKGEKEREREKDPLPGIFLAAIWLLGSLLSA